MEHTIKGLKTYRYEVLGSPASPKTILYVLHGYGHLAKFFIQKFHALSTDYIIVAPEGMHRFYLSGNSGRVGASWMTKESRETDIADNINWLNELDSELSKKFEVHERILLGFSQGCSTALRWLLFGAVQFKAIVIWASDFPPDLEEYKNKLSVQRSSYFVIGNNDEYCPEVEQAPLLAQYASAGFDTRTFQGGHDIESEALISIFNEINSK